MVSSTALRVVQSGLGSAATVAVDVHGHVVITSNETGKASAVSLDRTERYETMIDFAFKMMNF